MDTSASSFDIAFQTGSIQLWGQEILSVLDSDSHDRRMILRGTTDEVDSAVSFRMQAELHLTSFSLVLTDEERAAVNRFYLHLFVELMPEIAYEELLDSMKDTHAYYATQYRLQPPASLPSLKGKLVEPQISELLPISE